MPSPYRDPPGLRQCSRCGKIKPATPTFFQVDGWGKMKRPCRACLSIPARRQGRQFRQKLRQEMVDAYGGCCSCCGETALPFLTLEHVNHDGKEHREQVGDGIRVWRDLKRRGWPQEGYTILCWNCNLATANGDVCPHTIQLWKDLTRGSGCSE